MTTEFGPFVVDHARRQLLRAGTEIHVTPKSFELLALLIRETPRVVPKSELHTYLWPNTFVSEATLVGMVKELRRALGDRDGKIIRTAHRVGYAFAGACSRTPKAAVVSRWVVAGSRRIPLAEGENLIGRDPAAAIHVDVPGVSRRHARIVVTDRAAVLEDLRSKNGTSVNGVEIGTATTLKDADQIDVGVTLVFHVSPAGMSTDTRPRRQPPAPTSGAA